MSLDKRLSKTKEKSEEKIITLRMPQNKVTLLEILSKHYGLTMSTLVRDIIDESIIKLAREHLIVSEAAGLIIENKDGEKHNIRFFADIVDHFAPELDMRLNREDYCSDKDHDKAMFEHVKASYEYGFSVTDSWVNPDDGDEDVFRTLTKKTKVEK
jgi:predicted DNA-binding protein